MSQINNTQETNENDYKKLSHKNSNGGTIDINNINLDKDLSQSECLLEYLILVLCKNLQLKTKQVISLLSQNGKYLAHLLVKGVKGQYEPILSVY